MPASLLLLPTLQTLSPPRSHSGLRSLSLLLALLVLSTAAEAARPGFVPQPPDTEGREPAALLVTVPASVLLPSLALEVAGRAARALQVSRGAGSRRFESHSLQFFVLSHQAFDLWIHLELFMHRRAIQNHRPKSNLAKLYISLCLSQFRFTSWELIVCAFFVASCHL